MRRPRLVAALVTLGVAMLVASITVAVSLSGHQAHAGPPPPTPTPTPTPKPAADGSLSGIYDAVAVGYDAAASEDGAGAGTCSDAIDNGPDGYEDAADPECQIPSVAVFHCIIRVDHEDATGDLKNAFQCYGDASAGPPYDAVPSNVGEGPDLTAGPPPPLPYITLPLGKAFGSFSDSEFNTSTCLRDLGGTLGPNIISLVEIIDPEGQLAVDDHMSGLLSLYTQQSIASCDAFTPAGTPQLYAFNLYLAGGASEVAWRTSSTDFDGDGCTDSEELDKTGAFKCGDDPYNPLDSNQGGDYSGTYQTTVVLTPADWDTAEDSGGDVGGALSCYDTVDNGGGDGADAADADDCQLIPGSFVHCIYDVQQSGTDLTAPIYCYTDNAVLDVNPEDEPGVTGDGMAGFPPPLPFGDVDSAHAVLTGEVTGNTIHLEGCFEDLDGEAPLGYVYTDTTFNAQTGVGTADLWYAQTMGDCTGGTPAGAPDDDDAALYTVRQAIRADNRDTDTDGCPDANELSNNEKLGGLRDPFNQWDYFNPTNDGKNRIDDVLAVVEHWLETAPGPPYDEKYDRTVLAGGNAWNLGAPDGVIDLANDVLRAALQYRHDCGGTIAKSTVTPTPTVPPGLNFSIAVDVDGDTTDDCSTNTATTACLAAPAAVFDLKVYLNSRPTGTSYSALDVFFNYAGLTSSDNATMGGSWPDCDLVVTDYAAGAVSFGCTIFPLGTSAYTGLIGTNTLTCSQSGSITLVHGPHNTTLLTSSTFRYAETGGTETLFITCGTPTPTPTPVPAQGLAGNAGMEGDCSDGTAAQDCLLTDPHGIHVVQPGGGAGQGAAAGGSAILYFADKTNNKVKQISPPGPTDPTNAVAGGGSGTCGGSEDNALGDGCDPTDAILNAPRDVYVSPSGDIYIADTDNCLVRRISGGIIDTVAGLAATAPDCGYNGDGMDAVDAQLNFPSGIVVDEDDNLYIADTENCLIRKVDSAGVISTVAGIAATAPDCGYTDDRGPATGSQLNRPRDVSILFPDDDLVIADTDNHRIRRVYRPGGGIATIAGTGSSGFNEADSMATTAALHAPEALHGTNYYVYIADTQNDRIRRVYTLNNTIANWVGENAVVTQEDLQKPAGVFVDGETAYWSDPLRDVLENAEVNEESGTVDALAPVSSCAVLPGTSSIDWLLPAALLSLVFVRKRVTTLLIRLGHSAQSLRAAVRRAPAG